MGTIEEAVSSLSKENYIEELERIWNRIGESHNRRKISRQAFEVNKQKIYFKYEQFFIRSFYF